MAKLTPKQKMFVKEYLVDLNATQAAIRAGYSKKTADRIGPELLGKTCVAKAIQMEMDKRAERIGITADKVLRELGYIGFADISDTLSWDNVQWEVNPAHDPGDKSSSPVIIKGGIHAVPSRDLPKEIRQAIMSVKQQADGSFEIKMHPKIKALELIGRHLKMFTDVVEIRQNLAQDILNARKRLQEIEAEENDS